MGHFPYFGKRPLLFVLSAPLDFMLMYARQSYTWYNLIITN
jgi:hypothetical protein